MESNKNLLYQLLNFVWNLVCTIFSNFSQNVGKLDNYFGTSIRQKNLLNQQKQQQQQSNVNFHAPEFCRVFQQISEKQNKDGYYCIRHLNKFHQEQFERSIQSARVKYSNLKFAASKFAETLRFLTVQIPDDLKNLDDLRYILTSYLKKIEKVDIVFIDEGKIACKDKIINIFQPLVFRGLNVFNENKNVKQYLFLSLQQRMQQQQQQQKFIRIQGNKLDVEIINSNFEGVGLSIISGNKIMVQNSTFKNISWFYALYCLKSLNSTTIDNVRFLNCRNGLLISSCQDKVSIKKIYVKKCEGDGCHFSNNGDLNFEDSEIVDCKHGIWCFSTNSKFQNCQITNFKFASIWLFHSTVNYRQINIKKHQFLPWPANNGLVETMYISDSTFVEII